MLLLTAGCDDPVQVGPVVAPTGPGATGQPPDPAAAPDAGATAVAPLAYHDEDFVEIDVQNRDPFRPYAKMFKVTAPDIVQRRVVMADTGVDEMHLIAIVTGIAQPRAMLVDGRGVGHVVKRGDYIGRAEVIQTGGSDGIPVTLNWRVDRIRDNELVLTREDPTAPGRPPLTRVMLLREENEQQQRGEGVTVRSGEGQRGSGLFRPQNVREEVGSSLESGAQRTEQAAEPASP